MSEMVERVARAICLDRDPDCTDGGPHPVGGWLDEGRAWWTGYEDAARAAIEAMRDPTQMMLTHFAGTAFFLLSPAKQDAERAAYDGMINEALK